MTVTNSGPDTATGRRWFVLNTVQYDFVSTDSGCFLSTAQPQVFCAPGDLAAGASFSATVSLRVRYTSANDIVEALSYAGNDTNTRSNNNAIMTMWPTPPPPPPTSTWSLSTTSLPDAQQGQPYSAQIVFSGGATPLQIMFDGGGPPGLSLSSSGLLTGTPTENGNGFLHVWIFPATSSTPLGGPVLTGQISLNILPAAAPSSPPLPTTTTATTTGPSTGTKPPGAVKAPGIGHTILVSRRSQTTHCTRGVLPDRQCSPGAYYSGLTKAVLCSPTFRTGTIRNVPDSEKHQVEIEYGMAPKAYGRTIEIDHIISLEIGGSTTSPTSTRNPAQDGELPRQGQAREQAAQTRLRRHDDAARRPDRDRTQLAGALQDRLRRRPVASLQVQRRS